MAMDCPERVDLNLKFDVKNSSRQFDKGPPEEYFEKFQDAMRAIKPPTSDKSWEQGPKKSQQITVKAEINQQLNCTTDSIKYRVQ